LFKDPKPLIPFLGIPFIKLLIKQLQNYGIKKIFISINESQISEFNKVFDNSITLVIEREKLGTGGAVKYVYDFYNLQDAFVLNGDSYSDISLIDFYNFYCIADSPIVIAVSKNSSDRNDAGNIFINEKYKIIKFNEKFDKGLYINNGIYIINRNFLNNSKIKFSLESYISENLVKTNIYAFLTNSNVIDYGTPERYKKYLTKINNLIKENFHVKN